MNPKYPVYVISKGRFDNCLTAQFLIKDKVPFHIVVEPQEKQNYVNKFGEDRILVLPFSNLGLGSIPARNWVWEHSIKIGYERHWILDDNIKSIMRWFRGKRLKCNAGAALKITEDFIERYENIAIAGLNYNFFAISKKMPPFYLNNHVYSCLLILNKLNYRWRGRYNEDTDLCLQVLSGNWCTVLMNVFLIEKVRTMTMKGGNMESLYKADGRLKMARSLERMWPGVVDVKRRFQRPQHVIKNQWGRFDTQLILKKDINIKENNEYKLNLIQVKNIKSNNIKKLLNQKEYL